MSADRGGVFSKLLVLLVVLAAAASLAWMMFLPMVFTTRLRQRTGFDAAVESLVVNPFAGTIAMRGLEIRNPPTFPVAAFVEAREIDLQVDLASFFSDRLVLDSAVIDVPVITLVRRADGRTNAEAFQHNLAVSAGADESAAPGGPGRRFLIHRLTLRLGRLVIVDCTGREPVTREFNLGINHTYGEVVEVRQLFSPATLSELAPVGAALRGLVPGSLGRVIDEATKSGAQLLRDTGRKTGEKMQGYLDTLEESKKP